MGKLAAKLRFTWEYWVKGMHRPAPVSFEDDENCRYAPPDERLMQTLAGMYRAHGSALSRQGPWFEVDGFQLLTRVSYFDHDAPPGRHSIQMDVVTVVVKTREHIIESVGGFGNTVDEALEDALKNYADSVFHVLIAALLDKGSNQIEIEHWTIAGMRRKVILGALCCRGGVPAEGEWQPIFEAIQNRLSRVGLPPGLHWMRYYYAFIPGESVAEVLLDNETETELQDHLAQLDWPDSGKVYSRRLFFTIQDA